MLFPLVVLAIGAALAGFVGLGDNSIATWIQTEALPAHGPATLNLSLIVATTAIGLAGLALGTVLYRRGLPEREYLERLPWSGRPCSASTSSTTCTSRASSGRWPAPWPPPPTGSTSG